MEKYYGFDVFAWFYARAFALFNYEFVIYGYPLSFFDLFLFGVVAWGVMQVIYAAVDKKRS